MRSHWGADEDGKTWTLRKWMQSNVVWFMCKWNRVSVQMIFKNSLTYLRIYWYMYINVFICTKMRTMMCSIKIALTLGVHHPRGMVYGFGQVHSLSRSSHQKMGGQSRHDASHIAHRAANLVGWRCGSAGGVESPHRWTWSYTSIRYERTQAFQKVPEATWEHERFHNVCVTWLGFSICGHFCNPLRSVGSRSKEQALPQSHNIICSHQWSKRESFPLDRHWIYKSVCNKFREHILRVFFQLTVLDMPVIFAYLPGEFTSFLFYFCRFDPHGIAVWRSQFGRASGGGRLSHKGIFIGGNVMKCFLNWSFWKFGNSPLFLKMSMHSSFQIWLGLVHMKFSNQLNFSMNLVHSPIGVSLKDDINSLVSKIGDPPQFPAFRSQQWIKSDFVRESQMAVVVRFQHPFGWSNLWSEGIFWWSEYIEKNSWWIFGEYVCFICGSKQTK